MRVHNESGAEADGFFRVQNSQFAGQFLGTDQGVIQIFQIVMALAPGQVRVFVIRAAADDFAVAILKLAQLSVEFRDFGWANERKVFGVKEIGDPFTTVGVVVDLGQAFRVGANICMAGKLREFVANGQHLDCLSENWGRSMGRPEDPSGGRQRALSRAAMDTCRAAFFLSGPGNAINVSHRPQIE